MWLPSVWGYVAIYKDPASGAHLVIAAHDGSGTVSAKLTIDSSVPATSAVVLQEQRSLDVSAHAFTDTFGSYALHVYDVR